MKVIYKYQLNQGMYQSIYMPKGAEILYVNTQDNVPFIWALVDNNNPVDFRDIKVYGTGQVIGDSDIKKYIGTFFIDGGDLVFHCFEDLK